MKVKGRGTSANALAAASNALMGGPAKDENGRPMRIGTAVITDPNTGRAPINRVPGGINPPQPGAVDSNIMGRLFKTKALYPGGPTKNLLLTPNNAPIQPIVYNRTEGANGQGHIEANRRRPEAGAKSSVGRELSKKLVNLINSTFDSRSSNPNLNLSFEIFLRDIGLRDEAIRLAATDRYFTFLDQDLDDIELHINRINNSTSNIPGGNSMRMPYNNNQRGAAVQPQPVQIINDVYTIAIELDKAMQQQQITQMEFDQSIVPLWNIVAEQNGMLKNINNIQSGHPNELKLALEAILRWTSTCTIEAYRNYASYIESLARMILDNIGGVASAPVSTPVDRYAPQPTINRAQQPVVNRYAAQPVHHNDRGAYVEPQRPQYNHTIAQPQQRDYSYANNNTYDNRATNTYAAPTANRYAAPAPTYNAPQTVNYTRGTQQPAYQAPNTGMYVADRYMNNNTRPVNNYSTQQPVNNYAQPVNNYTANVSRYAPEPVNNYTPNVSRYAPQQQQPVHNIASSLNEARYIMNGIANVAKNINLAPNDIKLLEDTDRFIDMQNIQAVKSNLTVINGLLMNVLPNDIKNAISNF